MEPAGGLVSDADRALSRKAGSGTPHSLTLFSRGADRYPGVGIGGPRYRGSGTNPGHAGNGDGLRSA